jgi:hypothetical protein
MFASDNYSGKEKSALMLKKLAASATTAALAVTMAPTVAQAAEGSVEILTRTATAYGDRATDLEGNSSIFRPTYPLDMRVVCPAKREAGITVDPVNAHTIPGVRFTCTGTPQAVRFTGAGAPSWEQGWHSGSVTASLFLVEKDGGTTSTIASDVQLVRVNTQYTPGHEPATPTPPVVSMSRPSAPQAARGVKVRRVAKLSWRPPASTGGARILGYQAKVGPRVRSTTGLQVTVRGLKKNRRYSMFVRAFNRVGVSPWVRAQVSTRR